MTGGESCNESGDKSQFKSNHEYRIHSPLLSHPQNKWARSRLFSSVFWGRREQTPEGKTMFFNPTLIWFLIGLGLVLVEFLLPGIILVFFGVGAWIVSLTTFLGVTGSLQSQLLLFALASVVLLFSLRKWVRSRFLGFVSSEQEPVANLDEFAGSTVLVVQNIVPDSSEGRVEFKGAQWSAVADEVIEKGQLAVIRSVNGITLIVEASPGEEKS